MTDKDVAKLFQVLKGGGIVEPSGGIQATHVEVYRQSFEALGLTEADLAHGAKMYLLTAEDNFWPAVGRFLHLSGLRDNAKDAAETAWLNLLEIIRTHGRYPSITINDPALVEAVLLCGGYQMFCDTPEDELNFFKASFRVAYEKFRQADPKTLRNKFNGLTENLNTLRGISTTEQGVYIGYSPDEQQKLLEENTEVDRPTAPRKTDSKSQFKSLLDELQKRDQFQKRKAGIVERTFQKPTVEEIEAKQKRAREDLERLRIANPALGADEGV